MSSDDERPLRCFMCSAVITLPSEAIAVDGSHTHTRLNPANVVWHFGCYRSAPGCRIDGEPSTEHAWFKSCAWQYAHCLKCQAHLGWAFSGAESFFGLVVDRVYCSKQ